MTRGALAAALLAVLVAGCSDPGRGAADRSEVAQPHADAPARVEKGHTHRPAPAALIESDPALALVRSFDIGTDLVGICRAVARTTDAYREAVELGGDREAVDAEIDKALEDVEREHKEPFERALATAYGALLKPEELRSLAAEGLESKYADRLLAVRAEAGNRAVEAHRETIESIAGLAASFARMGAQRRAIDLHVASGTADPKFAEVAVLPAVLSVASVTTPAATVGGTPTVRLVVTSFEPVTIAEFGWFRPDGKFWRLGRSFAADELARHDCAGGRVAPTAYCKIVLDAAEVAEAQRGRTRWYFVGSTESGQRVQGQLTLGLP